MATTVTAPKPSERVPCRWARELWYVALVEGTARVICEISPFFETREEALPHLESARKSGANVRLAHEHITRELTGD